MDYQSNKIKGSSDRIVQVESLQEADRVMTEEKSERELYHVCVVLADSKQVIYTPKPHHVILVQCGKRFKKKTIH